jgi:hypothetical protein
MGFLYAATFLGGIAVVLLEMPETTPNVYFCPPWVLLSLVVSGSIRLVITALSPVARQKQSAVSQIRKQEGG